ncbi:MAG TPA: tetratricopeptide repeat protein [Candidatus Binatia bacterium]|nr:tetratricopeptide repeat protein [Candidatus Binatia bacterium]
MAQRTFALSNSRAGHMLLGYVYLWQKQYKQAIAEMEQAIVLYPNVANGYAILAEMLSRVGRSEEALR